MRGEGARVAAQAKARKEHERLEKAATAAESARMTDSSSRRLEEVLTDGHLHPYAATPAAGWRLVACGWSSCVDRTSISCPAAARGSARRGLRRSARSATARSDRTQVQRARWLADWLPRALRLSCVLSLEISRSALLRRW
jgi:hypothetical protein